MSPGADLTLSGESIAAKAAVDPVLTADGLRRRAADYVGANDPADGLFSLSSRPSRPPAHLDPGRFTRDPAQATLRGEAAALVHALDSLIDRQRGTGIGSLLRGLETALADAFGGVRPNPPEGGPNRNWVRPDLTGSNGTGEKGKPVIFGGAESTRAHRFGRQRPGRIPIQIERPSNKSSCRSGNVNTPMSTAANAHGENSGNRSSHGERYPSPVASARAEGSCLKRRSGSVFARRRH
jgi:hypothetical protein